MTLKGQSQGHSDIELEMNGMLINFLVFDINLGVTICDFLFWQAGFSTVSAVVRVSY